jgi:hypothetical protein
MEAKGEWQKGELKYDILYFGKNFCKCHNVSPPTTAIKKEKEWKAWLNKLIFWNIFPGNRKFFSIMIWNKFSLLSSEFVSTHLENVTGIQESVHSK